MKSLIKYFLTSLEKFLKDVLLLFLFFYQSVLSVFFGGSCRFNPTCSEYAVQALNNYSFRKAFFLIFKRLASCHPFGKFGDDPLPKCKDKEFHNV